MKDGGSARPTRRWSQPPGEDVLSRPPHHGSAGTLAGIGPEDAERVQLSRAPRLNATVTSDAAAAMTLAVRTNGPMMDTLRVRLERELARGGMGVVYLARDVELGRAVAYKALLPHLAASPELTDRFFAEVQVTAQLDHPSIVPIYGLERAEEGTLAFSMKLVRGRTLDAVLDDARAAIPTTSGRDEERARAARLEVFLKICDALAYAHDKGVLHRDLKPGNVMIGRYHEVYVMDWGLFRLLDHEADPAIHDDEGASPPSSTDAPEVGPASAVAPAAFAPTRVGSIVGTPWYMSPEQARGLPLDVRSDVYALGLILFELVSLGRAFPDPNEADVVVRAALGEKAKLVHKNPRATIPPALAAIVHKATAVARDARYASVRALADDLRRFLQDEEITARRASIVERAGRWLSRHRAMAIALLLAVPLAFAMVLIAVLLRDQSRLAAQAAHERRLDVVVASAAARASLLDRTMLRHQVQLQELARRAREALRAAPPTVAVYTTEDFDTGRVPPEALGSVAPYRRPVSLTEPVVVVAPGAAPAPGTAARLASLGRLMGWMAGEGGIYRAHVTLEDGVEVAYPGMGGYPPGYDPRGRARYIAARSSRTPHWGPVYRDHDGTLLLPCGLALHDDAGRVVGAVGITVDATAVAELLPVSFGGTSAEGTLVDENGAVVLTSAVAPSAAAPSPSAASSAASVPAADSAGRLAPRPFPFAAARTQMVAGEDAVGVVAEGSTLVGYGLLPTVSWHYAVTVDEGTVEASRVTRER